MGVIDTMIGFPAPREEQAKHYDFIRKQTHDSDSQEWEFPAQYMFKGVPHYDRVDDPVEMLMEKMNQHGITKALTGMAVDGNAKIAARALSRPVRRVDQHRSEPGHGRSPQARPRRARARRTGHQLLGYRPHPASTTERQEDVPDLREVHRARHPDLRVRGRPGAAYPLRSPRGRVARRGVLVLSRAEDRDAPRWRTVDAIDGEAAAQVAEPLLLHFARSRPSTTTATSSTSRTRAAPTRSSTPATTRWVSTSTGSSPSYRRCRSETTCGRSSCTRTRARVLKL